MARTTATYAYQRSVGETKADIRIRFWFARSAGVGAAAAIATVLQPSISAVQARRKTTTTTTNEIIIDSQHCHRSSHRSSLHQRNTRAVRCSASTMRCGRSNASDRRPRSHRHAESGSRERYRDLVLQPRTRPEQCLLCCLIAVRNVDRHASSQELAALKADIDVMIGAYAQTASLPSTNA